MKIKQGDRVRFMDSTGEGTVTRIEGRLAFVEDEDEFEIPVLLTELVLVTPVEEKVTGPDVRQSKEVREEVKAEPESEYEYEEEEGNYDPVFILAFRRGEKPGVESGSVRLSLINDSNYFCYYALNEVGMNGEAINLMAGLIEPNTKLDERKYLVTELDGKRWIIQLIMFKKGKRFSPIPSVQKELKLKGTSLMNDNKFVENDYFDEKALLTFVLKDKLQQSVEQLTDKAFKEIKKEKEQKKIKKKAKRRDEPGLLEIDLHIDELLDDTRGFSNSDILSIQMDKFHQVMKENLKNKKRKIVFIHGVGNGTLKTELRKALDRKYKGTYYQDASFREYGYGATMVII